MKDKKFPTILGVIFLFVLVFLGVYLSSQTTNLSSKASTSCEPINPQVTNLTYGSFDFSFTTSFSCTATLIINNKIYQDSSSSPTTHYFKISNLSPNTSYKFSLISGSTTFSRPEYSLTTTAKPNSSIPSSNLAWGKIVDTRLEPVSGAIIYLTLPGSQALSAFSNKDGNWNISLATSFNEQKTDWFTPPVAIDEDIIVYSPDGLLTQLSNRSDNNDPVPDIIVGQNYFSPTSVSTSTNNTLLDSSNSQSPLVDVTITNPKESEVISTLKPDIFGNGPANNIIQLKLDGISRDITVAGDNIWHYSPPQNLSLGPHKIVLTFQNQNITRNFSISETNDYLSFSATPSATLIPTQITTPTLKPTQVPTIRTAKPSTSSTLYKSGSTFPTYFLIVFSILLFGISIFNYRR